MYVFELEFHYPKTLPDYVGIRDITTLEKIVDGIPSARVHVAQLPRYARHSDVPMPLERNLRV